jgi:hypothetical protein
MDEASHNLFLLNNPKINKLHSTPSWSEKATACHSEAETLAQLC